MEVTDAIRASETGHAWGSVSGMFQGGVWHQVYHNLASITTRHKPQGAFRFGGKFLEQGRTAINRPCYQDRAR
jgi:hypothetical protein